MTKKAKAYFKTGGYSTEFTPKRGAGKSYALTRIPVDLWTAVRTKAKRQGVSLRGLILSLLKAWVEKP